MEYPFGGDYLSTRSRDERFSGRGQVGLFGDRTRLSGYEIASRTYDPGGRGSPRSPH